jgi:hypothetical protein
MNDPRQDPRRVFARPRRPLVTRALEALWILVGVVTLLSAFAAILGVLFRVIRWGWLGR